MVLCPDPLFRARALIPLGLGIWLPPSLGITVSYGELPSQGLCLLGSGLKPNHRPMRRHKPVPLNSTWKNSEGPSQLPRRLGFPCNSSTAQCLSSPHPAFFPSLQVLSLESNLSPPPTPSTN